MSISFIKLTIFSELKYTKMLKTKSFQPHDFSIIIGEDVNIDWIKTNGYSLPAHL